jgi:thymidylate kinase
MTKKSLITFDGMAGTRKTYFARRIAKELSKNKNVHFLPEFPNYGIGKEILKFLVKESKHDTAFRTGNPSMEMFLFLSLKLSQYKKLNKNNIILEDRGLPSIIGYYLIQDKSKDQKKRFNELYEAFEKFLMKSYITIILTSNKSNTIERLNKRNGKTYTQDEIKIENRLNKLLLEMAKTRKDWFVFDSGKLPESQIIKEIIEIINESR